MPLYFFDFDESGNRTTDDVGVELADQRAAEIQASIALTELAREYLPAGHASHLISVTVRIGYSTLHPGVHRRKLTVKSRR